MPTVQLQRFITWTGKEMLPPTALLPRNVLADRQRKKARPADNMNLHLRLREHLRLPLYSFTYSWTLSSKFFSTFPHGTCLLSVSGWYLALRGVYHALWAALPSNSTLGKKSAQQSDRLTGLSPSMGRGPSQGGLGLVASLRGDSPKHHIPRDRELDGGSVMGYARFIRHY